MFEGGDLGVQDHVPQDELLDDIGEKRLQLVGRGVEKEGKNIRQISEEYP
jgi:hypothetical protein